MTLLIIITLEQFSFHPINPLGTVAANVANLLSGPDITYNYCISQMVSFPTRCAPSLYKILHELSISIYHAGLVMALIGSLLTMLVVGHFTLSLSLFSVAICYSYHKSVLMEALFPDSDTTLCLLHENLEGKNKRPSGMEKFQHSLLSD